MTDQIRGLDQTTLDLAAWLDDAVDVRHRPLLAALLNLRRSTHRLGVGRGGTHYPTRPVGPDPRPELLRLLALPYADRPGYRPEWA